MEKVSVIIPTYNRADKVKKSINSVLQQTYSDFELLVVDDGSTDDTQAVVEAIPDSRIRYIKLAENKGASVARNEGVKRASCSLIAFQDSDDYWHPDKLEKQMLYWQEHPDYAMVYCPYIMHMAEKVLTVPGKDWEGLEGNIFPWLLLRNSIGTPTMLMKKECFLELGGFDSTLHSLEDWDFALRFADRYAIGYVDEPLVDAHYSAGGISSGNGAYYESRCRLIAQYKERLMQYDLFDPAVNELFQIAQQNGVLDAVKKMLMLNLSNW